MAQLKVNARAWKWARKNFVLEKYIEGGKTVIVSEKLRSYIHETIAIGWLAGFDAGAKAAKAEESNATS